jgi:hypothetical protein
MREFRWPLPQGTVILKGAARLRFCQSMPHALSAEGAICKESALLLGPKIKRRWFQLVWHPQQFVHLLYFEGVALLITCPVRAAVITEYFSLSLRA